MTGDRELLRGLEFSFSWSRTRPPQQTAVLDQIFITPDSLPVIEEAGRLLGDLRSAYVHLRHLLNVANTAAVFEELFESNGLGTGKLYWRYVYFRHSGGGYFVWKRQLRLG